MKRLAELQRKHAAKIAEMKALVAKSDEEVVSDEDKGTFEAIKAELGTLKESIELLKAVRELEAEEAEEPEAHDEDEAKSFAGQIARKAAGSGPAIRVKQSEPAKGTRAARFMIASHIAQKSGSQMAGVRYAQDVFNDNVVAKVLNTTTQLTGGALIPQDFVVDIIDLVRAKAVIRGSGPTMLPMPTGNATYPRLQNSATAYWQDELGQLTASEPAFDDIQFSAKKLTAQVPVTNDMLRRSPLAVEAIVRDDMVKQLALKEDVAFLLGTGTANQPAGLTTLIAATSKITNAVTAPTLATVNDVLMGLELLLTGKNVDTSGAMWVFHTSVRSYLSTLTDSTGRYFFRDELEAGRLLGYPYKTSNQLPQNLGTGPNFQTQIFFINMPDLIVADTLDLLFESSNVASYGANSAWDRDQTVFKCITEVDFNVKHNFSAAIGTVTNWRPSGHTVDAGAAFVTQPADTTGSAAKSAKP